MQEAHGHEIKMGSLGESYGGGNIQCITFCVTEECNLRCKYCYMVHKNNFRHMTLDVAKKAVDYLLEYPFESDYVQWDFIGGEPTLEMELIDQISDYIKLRMFEMNHKWFNHYVFSIGTNGILYDSEQVQKYIAKNRHHVSFGITIDGTKEKHDLQRVFPNGKGSYDMVAKNIALWQQQFPNATTKVTFSSDDLCMLKDSIIHLWNLGLKIIPANIVYENVWKENDPAIYENQLIELADYVIENGLWEDYSVRFFDPNVGLPLSKMEKKRNFCGTGKMIAVDCNGDFFPCIRFLDFCMPDNETPQLKSGNIETGLNKEVINAFDVLSLEVVNDGECATCPIASGCFTCTGNSYAYTYPHTIYSRTKYQCEMQKAQVRAINYFWLKLGKMLDYPAPREIAKKAAYENANWDLDGAKFLYFVLSDQMAPHCMYTPHGTNTMSQETFNQALSFAQTNNMLPVFLGDPHDYNPTYAERFFHVRIDYDDDGNDSEMERYIPVYEVANVINVKKSHEVCILQVKKEDVNGLFDALTVLAQKARLINVYPQDIQSWDSITIQEYTEVLSKYYKWRNSQKEMRATLNVFGSSKDSAACRAGKNDFTVAPNGKLYACPAYYFADKYTIGDVYSGLCEYDQTVFSSNKSPQCQHCDVTHCIHCHANNLLSTGIPNIPCQKMCTASQEITKALKEQV